MVVIPRIVSALLSAEVAAISQEPTSSSIGQLPEMYTPGSAETSTRISSTALQIVSSPSSAQGSAATSRSVTGFPKTMPTASGSPDTSSQAMFETPPRKRSGFLSAFHWKRKKRSTSFIEKHDHEERVQGDHHDASSCRMSSSMSRKSKGGSPTEGVDNSVKTPGTETKLTPLNTPSQELLDRSVATSGSSTAASPKVSGSSITPSSMVSLSLVPGSRIVGPMASGSSSASYWKRRKWSESFLELEEHFTVEDYRESSPSVKPKSWADTSDLQQAPAMKDVVAPSHSIKDVQPSQFIENSRKVQLQAGQKGPTRNGLDLQFERLRKLDGRQEYLRDLGGPGDVYGRTVVEPNLKFVDEESCGKSGGLSIKCAVRMALLISSKELKEVCQSEMRIPYTDGSSQEVAYLSPSQIYEPKMIHLDFIEAYETLMPDSATAKEQEVTSETRPCGKDPFWEFCSSQYIKLLNDQASLGDDGCRDENYKVRNRFWDVRLVSFKIYPTTILNIMKYPENGLGFDRKFLRRGWATVAHPVARVITTDQSSAAHGEVWFAGVSANFGGGGAFLPSIYSNFLQPVFRLPIIGPIISSDMYMPQARLLGEFTEDFFQNAMLLLPKVAWRISGLDLRTLPSLVVSDESRSESEFLDLTMVDILGWNRSGERTPANVPAERVTVPSNFGELVTTLFLLTRKGISFTNPYSVFRRNCQHYVTALQEWFFCTNNGREDRNHRTIWETIDSEKNLIVNRKAMRQFYRRIYFDDSIRFNGGLVFSRITNEWFRSPEGAEKEESSSLQYPADALVAYDNTRCKEEVGPQFWGSFPRRESSERTLSGDRRVAANECGVNHEIQYCGFRSTVLMSRNDLTELCMEENHLALTLYKPLFVDLSYFEIYKKVSGKAARADEESNFFDALQSGKRILDADYDVSGITTNSEPWKNERPCRINACNCREKLVRIPFSHILVSLVQYPTTVWFVKKSVRHSVGPGSDPPSSPSKVGELIHSVHKKTQSSGLREAAATTAAAATRRFRSAATTTAATSVKKIFKAFEKIQIPSMHSSFLNTLQKKTSPWFDASEAKTSSALLGNSEGKFISKTTFTALTHSKATPTSSAQSKLQLTARSKFPSATGDVEEAHDDGQFSHENQLSEECSEPTSFVEIVTLLEDSTTKVETVTPSTKAKSLQKNSLSSVTEQNTIPSSSKQITSSSRIKQNTSSPLVQKQQELPKELIKVTQKIQKILPATAELWIGGQAIVKADAWTVRSQAHIYLDGYGEYNGGNSASSGSWLFQIPQVKIVGEIPQHMIELLRAPELLTESLKIQEKIAKNGGSKVKAASQGVDRPQGPLTVLGLVKKLHTFFEQSSFRNLLKKSSLFSTETEKYCLEFLYWLYGEPEFILTTDRQGRSSQSPSNPELVFNEKWLRLHNADPRSQWVNKKSIPTLTVYKYKGGS